LCSRRLLWLCLGIPGITAHRAVHVAGSVSGRTVLVQGAAGSVGLCAVQLARQAGAHVIGTIRTQAEEQTARKSGAHEVFLNDTELPVHIRALVPEGIDHIVEVAFGANIERDLELLKMGGSINLCHEYRNSDDSFLANGVQEYPALFCSP